MAIIFVENSEHGNAPSGYSFDIVTGAPAINSVTPMRGTYDIRVGRGAQNTDSMYLGSSDAWSKLNPAPAVLYTHFWYKLVTKPSAGNVDQVVIAVDTGGGLQTLDVDENAHLYWLGQASPYFQLILSQKVEIETYYGIEGDNLVATLWVNGTFIGSYSKLKAGTKISSVRFGNANAATGKFNFDAYYDDIVADNARRIGTGLTLETEVPNADDGTEDEWSPNDSANPADNTYDHVKDIPTGVGSYAWCLPGSSDATTQEQLWAFPATTATGTVIAVDCLFNSAWLAGGSVRSFYHRIKLPSTGTVVNTDISTLINATTVPPFIYYRTCRATDPDGAAWTKASADALLVGGQRGADANAYTWRIYDVYKTVVYRDTPQDWAGII